MFAHYKNGDCALSLNSETEEHIKGKFLIYKWAKERFKDAIVEMEVYIPSSKQIADVMITFPENHALAGVKVVVEYQHSGITPEKWLERHALYREADLIDIWLLDYKVFYKNSTAINWENARLRKEIEKCIFKYTGFCYYLDTDNEEMIIDFNFETISDKKYGKYKPREYEFHKPCNEPVVLDDISIYYIEDIKAFVCYDGCHKKMIYQKLERLGNIYKIRDKKIQEIRTRKNYEKKYK
ncbi:competence protein CoiA family protein [Bacillus toyonensis]